MTTKQQKLQELKRLQNFLKAEQALEIRKAQESLTKSRYRELARPNQLPPQGEFSIWLVMAGRGFGKTWIGSGWIVEKALQQPETDWAIVAPTFTDVRRTCVEGSSGILKALTPEQLAKTFYNKSNGQITLPNGSKLHMISADEPERARGLNLSGAWLDEVGSWRYPETWYEGLAPALRIGNPQIVATTTPRPTRLLKDWLSRTDNSVVVSRGSTFDNAANLSESALKELRARYEGTRLGRQELYGELVTDVEGSLWNYEMIEPHRVKELPEFVRVVVAIDPATTSGEESDETGIVVVAKGVDGRGYVLADRSCRDSPLGWANRAVHAYEEFQADCIVAEKNQGGDMVETIIKQVNPLLRYKPVWAKVNKRLRAEPTVGLYEQGRISHYGDLNVLEEQMVSWIPDSGYSPDRLDALVHGLTELGFATGASADRYFASLAPSCPSCGTPNAYDAQACISCGHLFSEPEPPMTSGGFPII